jgi:hypothetical protein
VNWVKGILLLLCFSVLSGPVSYTSTAQAGTIELTVPDTCANRGDLLWLPIYTTDVTDSGVMGYNLVVKYDSTFAGIDSVTSDSTISAVWGGGFLLWAVLEGEDSLRIANAGLGPLSGSGVLVRIGMRIPMSAPSDSATEISIPKAILRDDPHKAPEVTHPGRLVVPCGTAGTDDTQREKQPFRMQRLGPSRIRWSIDSEAAPAGDLRIYDVFGRLVTVVEPALASEAASYTASYTWRGCESSGKQVAAGVYFYDVSVGRKRWSGKVGIMK